MGEIKVSKIHVPDTKRMCGQIWNWMGLGPVMFWDQVSRSLIMFGYVWLYLVRLGQVRLGWVGLGWVWGELVRLGEVRLGEVRLDKVRLNPWVRVRVGQGQGRVRLGQVALGCVWGSWLGQVRLCLEKLVRKLRLGLSQVRLGLGQVRLGLGQVRLGQGQVR